MCQKDKIILRNHSEKIFFSCNIGFIVGFPEVFSYFSLTSRVPFLSFLYFSQLLLQAFFLLLEPVSRMVCTQKRAVLITSTALSRLSPALLRRFHSVRLKNTVNAGPKPFYSQSNRRAAQLRLFSQRLTPTKTEPIPPCGRIKAIGYAPKGRNKPNWLISS